MPTRCRAVGAVAVLLTLALSACTSTAGPAPAQGEPSASPGRTLDQRAAAVRGLAQPNIDAGVLPGIVVALRDGDDLRVVALGQARTSPASPMRQGTRFPIASITKSMTATLVMQLVEENRLSLDDTVASVLPGLLRHGRSITVRDLLSHRSGLQEPRLSVVSHLPERAVVHAIADATLVDPPDSVTNYRNVNFVILALIVEHLRGEPLATTLRRHVFGPAGMGTAALPRGSTATRGVARGYDVDTEVPPLVVGDGWDGAGGVVASAADVDAFFHALFTHRLLGVRFVDAMVRPRPGTAVFDWAGYGLGLARRSTGCGEAVGHEGLVLGYSTAAWTMPRTGRSVVVLANSSARSAGGTFSGVLDIALCDQ